jgi:AbrB family looped-hinge helix DNA binding protein
MRSKNTAKLSARFKISVPKAIRTAMGWRPGQVFALIPKGQGILLMPIPTLDELSGLAHSAQRKGYRDRTDRIRWCAEFCRWKTFCTLAST